MTKVINLTAQTPVNVVTLRIEVGINDFHNSNMFCVTVSSPEMLLQSEGESSGCTYNRTDTVGYLATLKKGSYEYAFNLLEDRNYEDDWNCDFNSLSVCVASKEEVETIVSQLVKGFKSFYKAKRHDFLLKQTWLSKWEFIEES